MKENYRSGFVAIIGKPNVGKSTLMNHMIGHKLSITSRKPQTTRHRILGVVTSDDSQVIFVDTPGLHMAAGKSLNRLLNRTARGSMAEVDCILFVISAIEEWGEAEEHVLELVRQENLPVILVINKIDRLPGQDMLLPMLGSLKNRYPFTDIVPVSALKGANLDELGRVIRASLPEQEMLYPSDQLTDKSERFLVSEVIREQIFRQIGQEVPYSVAVELVQFKEGKGRVDIGAVIYVEKSGQKAILIGKGGAKIKSIGMAAREGIEQLLGKKVHLETWVKVKEKWSDDARALQSLGYGDSKT